jgi:ECF transporter S component (folate family)
MGNTRLKRIILAALLASMSAVIKIIFQITTLADFRFSLYEIPLIIAGIVLGPFLALSAGFAADWVYGTAFGYGLNLMTVTSMMWGLIPGLILYKHKVTVVRVTIAIFITAIIGFGINSVQLAAWSGWLATLANMPIRAIILFVSLPVQVYLVYYLHNRVVLNESINFLLPEKKESTTLLNEKN